MDYRSAEDSALRYPWQQSEHLTNLVTARDREERPLQGPGPKDPPPEVTPSVTSAHMPLVKASHITPLDRKGPGSIPMSFVSLWRRRRTELSSINFQREGRMNTRHRTLRRSFHRGSRNDPSVLESQRKKCSKVVKTVSIPEKPPKTQSDPGTEMVLGSGPSASAAGWGWGPQKRMWKVTGR